MNGIRSSSTSVCPLRHCSSSCVISPGTAEAAGSTAEWFIQNPRRSLGLIMPSGAKKVKNESKEKIEMLRYFNAAPAGFGMDRRGAGRKGLDHPIAGSVERTRLVRGDRETDRALGTVGRRTS